MKMALRSFFVNARKLKSLFIRLPPLYIGENRWLTEKEKRMKALQESVEDPSLYKNYSGDCPIWIKDIG